MLFLHLILLLSYGIRAMNHGIDGTMSDNVCEKLWNPPIHFITVAAILRISGTHSATLNVNCLAESTVPQE